MAAADREVQRVAVIGGGCSGLAAIKCCVDEGLTPVCFERTDEVGGLWRYTEHAKDGQACVMRSTVINTSKEMMCYSDYPIPKSYPNFMHNTHVWQYFQDFASHFQLYQYIRYNTEVKFVTFAPDYEETGKWLLTTVDHKSGEETTETFDAVLVCTGHHAEKNVPTFPGLADFRGQVLHSHDYREPSAYVGKRVVVIGIGNSGGDLAVELSRQGQVYLSTRRGTWVIHRLAEPGGLPIDVVNTNRFIFFLKDCMPDFLLNRVLVSRLNKRLDHDLYRLRPDYPPLAQHPMVNDELGNRIACGSVKVKADVKGFTATGVEFVDGTYEDDIDLVILATGYVFGFPFLDKRVVEVKENRLPFYKYMFPPDLPRPTLAVIGCIQPLGAIMPISELQCRLATRVFKGEVRLPSKAAMWEDIRKKEADMAKRYVKSQRHTIQVDYIHFMDELAELCGCKPHFWSVFQRDPALAVRVVFGPCTPVQYRILGPGSWPGARDAIMSTMDRVRFPLDTRPLPVMSDAARVNGFFVKLFVMFVVLFILKIVFI